MTGWRRGRLVWRAHWGRWRTRRTPSSDRGSATVWTVGAIAVLCVVFGAVLAMGQAVVVRHRAAGAADLAALAAADHWTDGATAACAEADRVARAQHARLVRCAVEGEISDVTAASGRGLLAAEVRSRAGPAGPVEPGGTYGSGRSRPARRSTVGGPGASTGAQSSGAARSSSVSSRTAPRLCSGSFPLPHLGDWMQDGQPASHSQEAMA